MRCAAGVVGAVVSAQLFVVSCGRSVAECKYVVDITKSICWEIRASQFKFVARLRYNVRMRRGDTVIY